MAASSAVRFVHKKVHINAIFATNCRLSRSYSAVAKEAHNDDSLYPPIKPRYPPGKWGNIPESRAWKYHERGQEILQIPRANERLEELAGEKPSILHCVNSYDKWPRTLKYKQYITKTHVIEGLPEKLANIDVSNASSRLHELANAAVNLEDHDKELSGKDDCHKSSKRSMSQILNAIHVALAPHHDHLLNSQVDEDVRLETFWWRGGFNEEVRTKGKVQDMLQMQFKDKLDNQLRCELPLPQFADHYDDLCLNDSFPSITYGPSAIGQKREFERPINISGHWIEDPCEFGLLSCYVMPEEFEQFTLDMGEQLAKEQMIQCGMTSSFASCVAQAYNQGFSHYFDVTYPFTAQTLVTDGNRVRLLAYQLNTLQLWKDDDANPLQNLCWISNDMPLYIPADCRAGRTVNQQVLDVIHRCLSLQPGERGVDLRPYLPDEAAPRDVRTLINKKGDEPMEPKKIGRWQYPRNAVYF